jgi:hypothetical protein
MVRNTIDFPMDWQKFIYQGSDLQPVRGPFEVSGDDPRW